jgi:succinate dehydrogenase / fumarate reductase flavoprotein subunit
VLITEACAARAASCSTRHGERFMERYAPNLKDLASARRRQPLDGPGDQGRARLRPHKDYVLLKLDHLGPR